MNDSYRLSAVGQDPIIHLFLCEATLSSVIPQTGLTLSSGYQAHYLPPQEREPLPLLLVPGPAREGKCGFWEIDPCLMPGLYGLQLPGYLRCPGYTYLYLHFPNTRPHYLQLHGVEYDPYDSFAIGLTTWVRTSCHEHLTSGLRRSMPTTLRPLLEDWLSGSH